MCEGTHQVAVGHVNKEVEVREEISTEYGLFYICKDEYPPKGAS